MTIQTVRNFHVPLSEQLYIELKEQAKRNHQSATKFAREAIEAAIQQKSAYKVEQELARYITETSGTEQDLDKAFETAAIKHVFPTMKRAKRKAK